MELQNHTRTRSAHTRKKFAKTKNKLIFSLASETTLSSYFFTHDHSSDHSSDHSWPCLEALGKSRNIAYFLHFKRTPLVWIRANKLGRVKMPPKKKAGKGKKVKKGKKKKEGWVIEVAQMCNLYKARFIHRSSRLCNPHYVAGGCHSHRLYSHSCDRTQSMVNSQTTRIGGV